MNQEPENRRQMIVFTKRSTKKWYKKPVFLLSCSIAAMGIACAVWGISQSGAAHSDPLRQASQSASYDLISMADAEQIALENAGLTKEQVTISKKKYEINEDGPFYEIEFCVNQEEYEYRIHAETGSIERYECIVQSDKAALLSPGSYIGMERALAIALQHAHVSEDLITVTKQKLEARAEPVVYLVEFQTDTHDYSYQLNPLTGEIVTSTQLVRIQ